ncbi:MAG: ABC transporter permease subunit [Synergistaceae bacterium]|jgi:His/Glu/Gln/Arg/opine family amino acid ABC transporter permease subunit|nr:ABC transporter permease subunit [Synergistaceae bacterium]MDD2261227.1 ABC transporter permease subunit [Clostridia bacterium]MDD3092647.1 ABC transporter permease subunit [Clostridia bacterium]MDD3971224.1 ABC transporter permease subunit [Clostridia bacterium]MDY0389164.1 ABC transporter permease subunit [Methanolobus sp.]
MSNFFEILVTYKEGFLLGLKVTLELCLLVWSIGIILGSLLGVLSAKYDKSFFGDMTKTVSMLISGVPVIVFLYWLYYPLQQQLNIDIPPFNIAVFALSFVNISMVADLVKNAIKELPNQYYLSAKVSGLSSKTFLIKIQIPLIFKQLVGPVLLVQITMLHSSIFASLINVDDIFRQIQRINAIVYKPIELYTALALFFITITTPLTLLAKYLKKKYARDYSER